MKNDTLNTKEGYIIDYISWIEVKAWEEEVFATQIFSKQLVEDFWYPKTHIQTRPQFRVKARPSDINGSYPVDIAIFKWDRKHESELYIIVECKKPIEKEWLEQLKIYLTLSNATIWVWFNWENLSIIRKIAKKNWEIEFQKINSLPRFWQDLDDIGKFLRKDLIPTHNLKIIFSSLRNYLAGNATWTTRDETIAKELINLIFCKIYDERFTKKNDLVEFRMWIEEHPTIVWERIRKLFDKVKTKYSEVIEFSTEIALDDDSISYIVWQLQHYSITETERDVVADAFEVFIWYALKWAQWQFFTPRNVVKVMVEIINPQPWEMFIDPACWSWWFLVETLRHKWNILEKQSKEYWWSESAFTEEKMAVAIKSIKWVEKDNFLAKVTKAYMAILWDGKWGIFCENSLKKEEEWSEITKQWVKLWTFDVLLANPPFWKDIKVKGEDILWQYDLAHNWKKQWIGFVKTTKLKKEEKIHILFVERCLNLIKEWWRMGIILPETFFHAPRSRYVLDYLTKWNNVQRVIDLPHNTFRPHNNAKCLAIILEKWKSQQAKINMAVAEEIGHDHNGKLKYRRDNETHRVNKNEVWDDINNILWEIKKWFKKHCFEVNSEECENKGIYVPRYYRMNKFEEIKKKAEKEGIELIKLWDIITKGIIKSFDWHWSPKSDNKWMGEIPYIRVKDIVNWQTYKDPTALIPEHVYNTMKWQKKLKIWDIVYVRRWSYRIWSVAILSEYDLKALLTREILVLRVIKENNQYDITPFYLLYLMSHKITQEQSLSKVLIETTLPNIWDRWRELYLPIHKDPKQRKHISDKVENIIMQKWKAQKDLEVIKKEFWNLQT